MTQPSYQLFDHTADIGLEVTAPTLRLLFEHAAFALFDVMLEAAPGGVPDDLDDLDVSVAAVDIEELIVRWLAELLYLHDTTGIVPRRFSVTDLSAARLAAKVTCDRYDPRRHHVKTEVKAVTYHQVSVRHEGGLWRARLVLDV